MRATRGGYLCAPRRERVFIVDLRHELDVQADPVMIQGAVHMTPAALEQGHAAIPRDREVVLYCS